jgi:hypothetical protein
MDIAPKLVAKAVASPMNQPASFDPALRAANLALSGRKHQEVIRRAAIELGTVDSRHAPWEAVALFSVGTFAFLCVLGLWFW